MAEKNTIARPYANAIFQVAEATSALPHWSGINIFMATPYLEDVHRVDEYDVAFVGVPFDIGTTYRSGTRFGPEGIRRISSL